VTLTADAAEIALGTFPNAGPCNRRTLSAPRLAPRAWARG
jgi:hypothetical protein